MIIRTRNGIFAAAVAVAACVWSAPSIAAPSALATQARISQGPTVEKASVRRSRIVEKLHAEGYTDVEIQGRRLFGYVVTACRDGRQYRLRFDPLTIQRGSRLLGDCPTSGAAVVDLGQIRRSLRASGYSEIAFINTSAANLEAEACRGNDRVSVRLSPSGQVRNESRIGRCGAGAGQDTALDLSQIRASLRDQGLRRIQFTDRDPPRYRAEACRDSRAVVVSVDTAGQIVHERDTGPCAGGDGNADNDSTLPTQTVFANLRALGFYNIRPISRDEPPTRVEACKSGRLFDLQLSRRGDIESRSDKGSCRGGENLTQSELSSRLSQRGYYNITLIDSRQNRYAFDACRQVRKFRVVMDSTGNLIRRSAIGWCAPGATNLPVRPPNIVDHFPSGGSLGPEDCDDYLHGLLSRTNILFETGSATISRRSSRLLEEIGHVMKLCPSTTIEVAGHTDDVGTKANNLTLSRERARAVVRYLVDRENVRRRQLRAVGYGEERPLRPNNSDRNRALNRRIEMVVLWGN